MSRRVSPTSTSPALRLQSHAIMLTWFCSVQVPAAELWALCFPDQPFTDGATSSGLGPDFLKLEEWSFPLALTTPHVSKVRQWKCSHTMTPSPWCPSSASQLLLKMKIPTRAQRPLSVLKHCFKNDVCLVTSEKITLSLCSREVPSQAHR